jgi:hypothetical protein
MRTMSYATSHPSLEALLLVATWLSSRRGTRDDMILRTDWGTTIIRKINPARLDMGDQLPFFCHSDGNVSGLKAVELGPLDLDQTELIGSE